MSSISYSSERKITGEQFVDLLKRSTLAVRRPVNNRDRIEKMLQHGNVLVTAWDGEKLVGVSRGLCDFAFCCYLSDLAVDEKYQHRGIGKELIRLTHETAGENTTLILLAAPAAEKYYPKVGMEQFTQCYIIKRKSLE